MREKRRPWEAKFDRKAKLFDSSSGFGWHGTVVPLGKRFARARAGFRGSECVKAVDVKMQCLSGLFCTEAGM